jgi:hypothetical protein
MDFCYRMNYCVFQKAFWRYCSSLGISLFSLVHETFLGCVAGMHPPHTPKIGNSPNFREVLFSLNMARRYVSNHYIIARVVIIKGKDE